MLKEPFEIIKAYCKEIDQTELFELQTWYHFVRIIRNAMSHDFRFNFSSYDKTDRLPLTWKEKTLTASMDGDEMTIHFLTPVDVWYLVEEMKGFVINSLK